MDTFRVFREEFERAAHWALVLLGPLMLARFSRAEFTVYEIAVIAVVAGLIAALTIATPVH